MRLIDNTPFECYEVSGVNVWVKREDLCTVSPAPPFSKIRGVYEHLFKVSKSTLIGVLDTQHSMAGWGVAYVCQDLELDCIDFYPVLKADTGIRHNQQMAQSFGAMLHPMKAGMSAVLFNQAKRDLRIIRDDCLMMPNGLKLLESVDATAKEVLNVPRKLIGGTWIISISSGTIGSGVIKGLSKLNFEGKIVLHMGYSRSSDETRHYVISMCGFYPMNLTIIDEQYEYKDKVDNSWIPFPCNKFYDAKAFLWLAHNVKRLKQPIIFWNIGGD